MQGPELLTLNYGSRAWQAVRALRSRRVLRRGLYQARHQALGIRPQAGRRSAEIHGNLSPAPPPWTYTSYVRASTILTLPALCVVQYSWTRTAKYMASQNYFTGGTNNDASE